jgi:mannose-6-phosphate isomerase-like protein (cupin superfamily)
MSAEAEQPSDSGAGAAPRSGERELDFRPGMDMTWKITRRTADTGGELFEATNWVAAHMGGPPVHVHPSAEESYEVIEGALDVFVDGKWSTLRVGETATVPAGVPHTLRNASAEPVRLDNIHRPAMQFEPFFEASRSTTKSPPPRSIPA